MFGFFSYPNKSTYPVLESQHVILYGTRERIFLDLENSNPSTRVLRGKLPFAIDGNKDAEVDLCVYDPSYGENN